MAARKNTLGVREDPPSRREAYVAAIAKVQEAGFGHGRWPWLQLNSSELHELLLRHSVRDYALARISGRWQAGSPDPAALLPGDIAPIRGVVTGNTIQAYRNSERRFYPDPVREFVLRTWLRQALLLQEAVPFYLSDLGVSSVLASRPPDPELVESIRLPFLAVVAFFEHELQLPEGMVWPRMVDELIDDHRQGRSFYGDGQLGFLPSAKLRGGAVTGVVLVSAPGGIGLSDYLLWLISTEPDSSLPPPENLDRSRNVVEGRLSHSLLAPVIHNLAAVLSWGEWCEPPPMPPGIGEPGSARYLRSLSRGRSRKRILAGALSGVRVLDLQAMRPRARSAPDPARTHASPIPHHRRGHWRSVRVGPRSEWHYEGRWIAPVFVNPHGLVEGRGLQVYRLPHPDVITADDDATSPILPPTDIGTPAPEGRLRRLWARLGRGVRP
jgi:hypothetical protein